MKVFMKIKNKGKLNTIIGFTQARRETFCGEGFIMERTEFKNQIFKMKIKESRNKHFQSRCRF